ncbi:MAG: hypothetical protein RB191_12485, partial [Terriglobia bacterium]|nr:hypothetical protein [Terriglobia bacterium]
GTTYTQGLLVNTTSNSTVYSNISSYAAFKANAGNVACLALLGSGNSSAFPVLGIATIGNGTVIGFYSGTASAVVGSVNISSSATTYGTSSGEFTASGDPFKTDAVDLSPKHAWEIIKALAPKTYTFAKMKKQGHGFLVNRMHVALTGLGHDLTEMGLYAAPDAEGNGGSMDYGKVTPFLTAAVLDLNAGRVNHEERIAALEKELAVLKRAA